MIVGLVELDGNGNIIQSHELDDSKHTEYVEIALQDMTLEDYIVYQKHKEERNKRVYKKMGYDYDER